MGDGSPAPAVGQREVLLAAVLGLVAVLLTGLLAPIGGLLIAAVTGGSELAWSMGLGLLIQGAMLLGLVWWLAAPDPRGPTSLLALGPGRRSGLFLLVVPVGVLADAAVDLAREAAPWLDLGSLGTLDEALLEGGAAAPLVVLGVVLVAPVVEEVFFRGLAYGGLMRSRGALIALLGSALLFTLYHADPLHMVGVLVVGLWLGWLRWYTGSLRPCVAAHVLNNLNWVLITALPQLNVDLPSWAILLAMVLALAPIALSLKEKP